MTRFSIPIVLVLPLAAAACNSASGPVAPTNLESPASSVVVHHDLASLVTVPTEPAPSQGYRWTPDNLLQYFFRLQNRSGQRLGLRIRSTFLDEEGASVDEQQFRIFLAQDETETVPVTCTNTKGKRVQVQVLGLQ